MQMGLVSSHWWGGVQLGLIAGCVLAHLYFLDATSETPGLTSGILGAFPLLGLIARLGCHYMDITTPMRRGIVTGGGYIGVSGGRARGKEEVSVAGLKGGESTYYVMLSVMGLAMGGGSSGG